MELCTNLTEFSPNSLNIVYFLEAHSQLTISS